MAGKRKTKTPKHDAALGPSKWRLQHGGFGEAVRSADPETGTPVAHRYAMDTLGVMLSNGTITTEMRDAGEMFRKQFRFAALDTLRPMPLIRIPGGRGGDTATEQQFQARERVAAAIVSSVDHGRRRAFTSPANQVVVFGFRFVAPVYRRLVGPLYRRLATGSDPIGPTAGNVLTSSDPADPDLVASHGVG